MIEHLESERFDEKARLALQDKTLRGALKRATNLFGKMRAAAIEQVPDWEELREQARLLKDEVLADLPRWLDEFTQNAEKAGAQVHRAADAAEANAIVVRIAKEAQAKKVVKSKSMTTEEIGLNEALERAGCEPIETDLGEWIIQLAGERPSHIIAPAIHKTRRQVSELFEEKIGIEPTDDVAELAGAARKALRRYFAEADLGISGVNFAIAETGSILIVENEGNARLSTSLPRVHVAMMGIEKVIPKLADLELFMRLLPRSGTGQHLTSYQSLITGPARGDDREAPGEMHIVVLDNGRWEMQREEITRQSLRCIRCGACLNACPVYQQIGGHAYGSVYPGPIGAVITPQLAGLEKAEKLPFASSLCGACRDVCPVKIDIPELLLHLRARVKQRKGTWSERTGFRVWAWFMGGPRRYRFAARMARFGQRWAPPHLGMLGRWRQGRELRPFAKRTFRNQWKENP